MLLQKGIGDIMKFSGKSLTDSERNKLLRYAKQGADECCIGYMKTENGRYIPVARFFNNGKFLFYVTL